MDSIVEDATKDSSEEFDADGLDIDNQPLHESVNENIEVDIPEIAHMPSNVDEHTDVDEHADVDELADVEELAGVEEPVANQAPDPIGPAVLNMIVDDVMLNEAGVLLDPPVSQAIRLDSFTLTSCRRAA